MSQEVGNGRESNIAANRALSFSYVVVLVSDTNVELPPPLFVSKACLEVD